MKHFLLFLSLFVLVSHGGYSLQTILIPNPAEASNLLKLLYISCGDQDNLIQFSQRTHEYCKEHGVPHIYRVISGGHHDFAV